MNAHNEQHDPASAVVKQNLTTQPAAAQEAVGEIVLFGGYKEAAWSKGRMPEAGTKLYAAPVTAVPASYVYASEQATTCAGCGEHKHTPLRIDAMGGYVCLTCIDQKLGSLLGEFGYTPAAPGIDIDSLRRLTDGWLSHADRRGNPHDEARSVAFWGCAKELRDLIDASQTSSVIDMGVPGATLTIDGKTFTVDEVRAALLPGASPKDELESWKRGTKACAEVLGQVTRQMQDSPKGGSEAWREGWALAYSGPSRLYGDDGELQDNSEYPYIDWRRDSAEVIRDKITERANRKLAKTQAGDAEVQP